MLDLGTAVRKDLSEDQAEALILQALLASAGEGMPLAKLRTFVRVQSGRTFSDHRCDKTLHNMVKRMVINVDVNVTKGGVVKRSYSITLEGVCMLYAVCRHLPKQSQLLTQEFMRPMLGAVASILNTAMQQNGNGQ